MKEKLENLLSDTLMSLVIPSVDILVTNPKEEGRGDYMTSVALTIFSNRLVSSRKDTKEFVKEKFDGELNKKEHKDSYIGHVAGENIFKNPKEIANKIADEISKNKPEYLEKVEVAGPGFINFYLSRNFFTNSISEINKEGKNFGKNENKKGEKVIVEYTDPNPFKEFHIGHLMSNTIGESISRIVEYSGAETKRACYQGDVGIHVAKTIWAMTKNNLSASDITPEILGKMYSFGSKSYEENEIIKKEIEEINKKIYEKDPKFMVQYETGRKISLEYFEEIYKKLGTKFDFYFLESETGGFGKEVVEEHLEKGVFEKSDGAIVFRGEQHEPSLHTRVFVSSQGLPTYEAKELGLAKKKYEKYPYTTSIVVTGNEINDYFKVLLGAMKIVFPDLAEKTKHISHGMLRLPTGKMSSRTGDVITGESLLSDIGEKVVEKIKESNKAVLSEKLINEIAVGALKYSVLKQATGKDIIFDFDKSLSFEGDSGPYLQYSYARAQSIIEKAKEEGISIGGVAPKEVSEVERMLCRFPEVVIRAQEEYSPQYISTYLIDTARAFNTYYAKTKIVDKEDKNSGYKVALTEAFANVIKNGLYLLGIQAPEKM